MQGCVVGGTAAAVSASCSGRQPGAWWRRRCPAAMRLRMRLASNKPPQQPPIAGYARTLPLHLPHPTHTHTHTHTYVPPPPRSAEFHPLKYMQGLARVLTHKYGVRLYEGTRVTDTIDPQISGRVSAGVGWVRMGLSPELCQRLVPLSHTHPYTQAHAEQTHCLAFSKAVPTHAHATSVAVCLFLPRTMHTRVTRCAHVSTHTKRVCMLR